MRWGKNRLDIRIIVPYAVIWMPFRGSPKGGGLQLAIVRTHILLLYYALLLYI